MPKVARERIFDSMWWWAERLSPLLLWGSSCCPIATRGPGRWPHSAPAAGLGTPKEPQAGSGLSRPVAETPAEPLNPLSAWGSIHSAGSGLSRTKFNEIGKQEQLMTKCKHLVQWSPAFFVWQSPDKGPWQWTSIRRNAAKIRWHFSGDASG